MYHALARKLLNSAVIFYIVGFVRVQSLKCYSTYNPSNFGYCNEARDCTGATLRHNCTGGPSIVCCIFDSGSIANFFPSSNKEIITRDLFYEIAGNTLRTQSIYPFFNQALIDASITAKSEIAAFTAQVLFTTENMTTSEEDSDGSEYEGDLSLGNNRVGDGAKFRSRGFLPLVGRNMYTRVNDAIKKGLLSNPEKAALPSTGFEIASWLWKNGYTANSSEGLGKYCDGTTYNFIQLSFEIHQKTDNIEKQLAYWWKTLKVLGLPCPTMGSGPSCTFEGKSGTCMMQSDCKGRYGGATCSQSPLIKCCLNCQNPVDLAFVVDSSGSVGPGNFQKALQFIADLCNISSDGTQVALIRFSTKAEIIFHFKNHTNKTELLNAIRTVQYIRGGTNTDLALKVAHQELFGTEKYGVRQKSRGIPRVLVLLTDGRANKGTDSVKGPSEALRADGVNIFAVGIGPSINLQELKTIASDPDKDYVMLSQSFEDMWKIVKVTQERSCYEPALLEPNTMVSSSVDQHLLNYYKYKLQNGSGIQSVRLKPLKGQVRLFVSLKDKNPRDDNLSTGLCEDQNTERNRDVHSFFSNLQLKNIKDQSVTFCTENPSGAVTSSFVLPDESIVVYAIMCSSRILYVAVEGLDTSEFNLTLMQGDVPNQVNFTQEANSSYTFAIRREVYVSAGVAMTATTATVAAYVTLSCAGKSFEIQASSNVKKKKKKKMQDGTNNNDLEKGETNTPDINNGTESLNNNKHKLSTSVTIFQASKRIEHETTEQGQSKKSVTSSNMKADMKTFQTIEEGFSPNMSETPVNEEKKNKTNRGGSENPCGAKNAPKLPHRNTSLISSMIGALSRKDSQLTAVADNKSAKTDKGTGSAVTPKKEVRSGSVTVDVKETNAAINQSKRKNGKTSTKKATGIENVHGDSSRSSKQHVSISDKPMAGKKQSGQPVKSPKSDVEKRGLLVPSESSLSLSQPSEATGQSSTSCCVVCLPIKSSSHDEKTEEYKQQRQSNNAKLTGGAKAKKKSFKERLRSTFTKRNIMACFCPCFTYYILDNSKSETQNTEEHEEKREKRLERDMKISQAFCILLSQAVFFFGAEKTENKIQCAAVAISMNYLYLVALGWLVSQALYIFSFTKTNQSAKSRSKTIKYYYISAWGLPLIVVLIMMGNTDAFSDNAHCWVSFMDSISWAVSTPLITMSLVQIIIVVLLIKALVTFKKTKDQEEDEIRMGIIRSGLVTVACLFLTILLAWFLGTVSLNIDKKVYSDAYAVFNALQGVLLFLFFVVLSPEIRLLVTSIWLIVTQLKENAVTPFDEYEGLEIEDDEEKDKKKKSNAKKAMKTGTDIAMASTMLSSAGNTKTPRKQESQKDASNRSATNESQVEGRTGKTTLPRKEDTTGRKKSAPGKLQPKDNLNTLTNKTSQLSTYGSKPIRGSSVSTAADAKVKNGRRKLEPIKSSAQRPKSPNLRKKHQNP